MREGYGIPHIPLSRLRELWGVAKDIYFGGRNLDNKDLFRLFIRQEIDRIMVQHYQSRIRELELEKIEVYTTLANVTEKSINMVNELASENRELKGKLEKIAGITLFGIADVVEQMTVEDYRYDD